MSDISHKKAMDILKSLEGMTGYAKEDAKNIYESYRDEGYTRIEAVKRVWDFVLNRYFDILCEVED